MQVSLIQSYYGEFILIHTIKFAAYEDTAPHSGPCV